MRKFVASIAMLILFVCIVSASQVHLQPYGEIAKNITKVCILKVEKVESEEKYQHFKNGVKRLVSTTIIIHGTVEKHLLGEFESKKY